jgi:hypothetical protein
VLLAGRRNVSLSPQLPGLTLLELVGTSLEQGVEPNRIEDNAFAETVATIQGLAALAQAPAVGKVLQIPESWLTKKKPIKKNRELARIRVIGEHINRKLKIFKILADRYRNRRKRFGLRFNLIAGLYNYELRLSSTETISNFYE